MKPILFLYANLPPIDGERKKPLRGRCFRALISQFYPDGGFETHFKAAVLYALIQNDALTLAGSAAHGGSRHEAKSVSTKSDGV